MLFFSLGRYDLHLPRYVCQTCLQQWAPDVRDLVRSGYWPASANASTIYTVDLLNSFQEQAFAKRLEHRTLCAGRVSMISAMLFTMLARRQYYQQIIYIYFEYLKNVFSYSDILSSLDR